MRTGTIVVATDGTASSRAAIRWAAREAARRQATLRVTHVIDWQRGDARYDLDGGDFTGLQLLHHADSPVYLDRQAA